MTAYYNEYDPKAAAWLKKLIKNGLISDGEVDDRSITDVEPKDLIGFTQHHFFAGIGGWSYALRLAGWPDNREVCTASLPCQPFSIAGAGKGKSDERHLLPHFIELVKQCNFKTIFGEQVPGAIKHGWLDDLCLEMERENYAVGSIVLTAAGAGAPHIRQRLYWVADSINNGLQGYRGFEQEPIQEGWERTSSSGIIPISRFCDTQSNKEHAKPARGLYAESGDERNINDWTNPEWIFCRDNKYRPIKPGIKPLANGLPKRMGHSSYTSEPINANNTQEARVMRLKGYGNAIVPNVAASFISSFIRAEH
jgi:DNA (cytosine-5)-methyltransferase 1